MAEKRLLESRYKISEMINEETIKPTLSEPVNQQSKNFEKNFKKTMTVNKVKLNEFDNLLTEKEYSLKKKIFTLPKMEALVFSDPKLLAKYNEMSEEGEEKFGYHYNETIMNMLFNDYVLNSSKYLQKYKMAVPKEKKRRDKSGINQAKKAGEEIIKKMNPQFKVKKPEIQPEQQPQKQAAESVGAPTEVTKVQFLVNEKDPKDPDVFAYFPEENFDREGKFKTAYSHIGQHSSASPQYAAESRPATPEEYADLKAELEGIGYNLEVLNQTNETSGTGSVGGAGMGSGGYAGPAAWKKGGDLMEDTTTASVGGSGMGSGGYAGPAAWGGGELLKKGKSSPALRKPIWPGGTVIQESNYLTDPSGFEKFVNMLNENIDDIISDKTSAFSSDSIKGWNNADKNVELDTIKTGTPDKPNLNTMEEMKNIDEKAKSKEQQQLFGIAHAAQKGDIPMSKLGGAAKKIAKTVDPDDVEDFASTKHKGLPDTVNENPALMTLGAAAATGAGQAIGNRVADKVGLEEDTQTMIQNNGTSMSNKATPTGDQPSNIDMGARSTGGMQESDQKLFEELDKELEAFSIHHNKLKVMAEDRKPSALVLRDRVGSENEKNFKKDLGQSGTKEIIDVEKELQWKDQQTDVPKDPQKLGLDIEKKEIKTTDAEGDEALKNVGDSTNDKGDEIPKRNMTSKEQHEVDMMRLGQQDLVYDNEPSKRFEDRMKADMGDTLYKQRQEKMEFRGKAPMYNKDTQPVEDGIEKDQFNKEKAGFNKQIGVNESIVSGKYYDLLGKRRIIDFKLNETLELATEEDCEKYSELNFDGMGNTYTNKVDINEGVVDALSTYKFYTDGSTVYRWKSVQNLNESEQKDKKPVINEQMNKMKHLLGYKPNDFVNTKSTKENRGF